MDPWQDDPAYLRWEEEMRKRDELSQQRRGKPRPHQWGDRLDGEYYFCSPCWDSGDLDGRHPDSTPPCDPPARFDIG